MDRRTTLLGSAGAALLSQLQACSSGDASTGSVESAVATEWTPVSDAAISEKAAAVDNRFYLPVGIWHIETNYHRHFISGRVEMWEPKYDGSLGTMVVLGIAEYVRSYVYESTHIIRPHHLAELTVSDPNQPPSSSPGARIRLVLTDSANRKIDTLNNSQSSTSWKIYSRLRAGSDGVYRADYRVDFFSTDKHLASVHFRRKEKAISSLVNRIVTFVNAVPAKLIDLTGGQTIQSVLSAYEMYPGSRTVNRTSEGRTTTDEAKFHTEMDKYLTRGLTIGTEEFLVTPRFEPYGVLSGYSSGRPLVYYVDKSLPENEAAAESVARHLDYVDERIYTFALSAKTSVVDSPGRFQLLLTRAIFGDRYVGDLYHYVESLIAKLPNFSTMDHQPLLRRLQDVGLTMDQDGRVDFSTELTKMVQAQSAGQTKSGSSTWAGLSFSGLTAFQLGVKCPTEWNAVFDCPALFLVQGGLRVSLVLEHMRQYIPMNGDAKGSFKNYVIPEYDSKGVRLTATLTVGPAIPAADAYFSAQLEVNFNLRIKGGKCRIDSIVIDPVLDGRVPDIVRPLLKKYLKNYNPELYGSPGNITGNAFARTYSNVATTYFFEDTDAIVDRISSYTGPFGAVHQPLVSELQDLTIQQRNDLYNGVVNYVDTPLRNYRNLVLVVGQLELSPLRIVFLNGEVSNPDYAVNIRKGFQGKCHIGYAPAGKLMNFVGGQATFSLTGKAFARLAIISEASAVFGSDDLERSFGAQW